MVKLYTKVAFLRKRERLEIMLAVVCEQTRICELFAECELVSFGYDRCDSDRDISYAQIDCLGSGQRSRMKFSP